MRTTILAVLAGSMLACGGSALPSPELVNARAELVRAQSGPAGQNNPTDIHEAQLALNRAESANSDDPSSPVAVDLAVIAQLKAQTAESVAATMVASARAAQAQANMQATESAQLKQARTAAATAQGQAALTQEQLQQQRQETADERQKRMDAEKKLADARDTLARIAQVKEDDRGLVLTFQGESLFVTAKSDLLPAAMVKLDQVAESLRGQERKIDVIGYTDNQGGVGQYNQDLSEKRAAAVKNYLVAKGIPSDLIRSEGRGATQFVADNSSIEGRSANRRVEVIVEPKTPRAATTP